DLGVVCCGATARYQNVGTDAQHRRRGLASHLLGVAARWASARGCSRWVIVTEASNPAGRVYRSVGFGPAAPTVQAYRRPVVTRKCSSRGVPERSDQADPSQLKDCE